MPGKGGKKDPKKENIEDENAPLFKPAHIKRIVKKMTKMRVSRDTLKACSAAVTAIMKEILDGGINCCKGEGKKKVSPRHINTAITSDVELRHFLKDYVIQSGGSRQFTLPEASGKN